MFTKFRTSGAIIAALVLLVLAGAAFSPGTASAEDPYHGGSPFECGTYEAQLYGCGGNSCYNDAYNCGGYYGCDPYYQGYGCNPYGCDYGHGCGGYGYCDPYYGHGCGGYGYCDPYYDHDDDDCYDYCDGYYHDDDDDDHHCYSAPYPGFLSVVAAPSTINCGSTTTITVDIHLPHPYASGVTVGLSNNVPGVLKPAGLQQSVNGRAVFTYTAPADWNGPVLIGANTEYEAGNLTIQVVCKTGNPPVPQIKPIVSGAATGGIQPPNTGDGGLIAADDSSSTQLLLAASIAMVASALYVVKRLTSA